MEESATFLNSPLFGVIIGGLLTVITTFIGQWISLKKEERIFDKRKKLEENEWLRNEQKAETENIRNIFKNVFSTLSIFIATENQEIEDKQRKLDERKNEIQNIIDWISLLKLRYPLNSELNQKLKLFEEYPDGHSAYKLREEIDKLVKREDDFFISKPKKLSETKQKQKHSKIRKLSFKIDDDFRRTELIKRGNEINEIQEMDVTFKDFSESQREILSRIYFDNSKSIQLILRLYLPVYDEKINEINFRGKIWQAKLNPNKTDLSKILSIWENEFKEALEREEKLVKDHDS